ncbi:MAG: hypothetical protein WC810_14590 [Janthinobacterium sp.]|jgi:hypothetical protein
MVIAIDFDGTCVSHEFPLVGNEIGADVVLKELVEKGHQLVLFTMRSNRKKAKNTGDATIQNITGKFLDDAVNWFAKNEIPLYGIQSNPTQKNWTTSPKCYAQLYIDDAALGCPLMFDETISNKPFVDWGMVRILLIGNGIL